MDFLSTNAISYMKQILFLLALFASIAVQASEELSLPIRGIADGDTILTNLDLPCPLCQVSIRIRDIDTPESNHLAKCDKEKELGLRAKKFLENFVKGKDTMVIKSFKWDKYGGRIDARVEINGVDIGRLMSKNGFAVHYTGKGAKYDWCS